MGSIGEVVSGMIDPRTSRQGVRNNANFAAEISRKPIRPGSMIDSTFAMAKGKQLSQRHYNPSTPYRVFRKFMSAGDL